MINMPPNPFQSDQSDPNMLDNARHLRVYEEDGKLRVETVQRPFDFPVKTVIEVTHDNRQYRFVMHIDIETDEKTHNAIKKRMARLCFQYITGLSTEQD